MEKGVLILIDNSIHPAYKWLKIRNQGDCHAFYDIVI